MKIKDFEDLQLSEIDLIQQTSIDSLRKGFKWKNSSPFPLESRLDNNIMTDSLCYDLENICNQLNNWSFIKHGQNNYLIYKEPEYVFVFKVRNSNPIDTQNIRNKLSNGRNDPDQNANVYVANQVSSYLNKPYNGRLKEALQKYPSDKICFFHFVWFMSENDVDRVHVGVTYTIDVNNKNNDWYLHLISDSIIEEQTNESVNDDLVTIKDNTDQKANIIKLKRLDDDQGKQSV